MRTKTLPALSLELRVAAILLSIPPWDYCDVYQGTNLGHSVKTTTKKMNEN